MEQYRDLYIAGHRVRHGYAVMMTYQEGNDARYYTSITKARAVVERFNRLQARRRNRPNNFSENA